MASRMKLPTIVALSLGVMSASAAPASAQFFGGLFGGGWGPRPIVIDRGSGVIPPFAVARILNSEGYRLTDRPALRGDRLYALAVDGYGRLTSVVLDAYSGSVLRAVPVGGETRVSRDPNIPGDIDSQPIAPRAKPKPRIRTAARPPTAPPVEVTPASPPAAPTQATRSPTPVVPVAPPPAIAAPAAPDKTPAAAAKTSAPVVPTRAAPDAQPADIGPKVVPVKPTGEAKAPPPPADYDTEAGPRAKTVTPEQANKMAPEMHKDE